MGYYFVVFVLGAISFLSIIFVSIVAVLRFGVRINQAWVKGRHIPPPTSKDEVALPLLGNDGTLLVRISLSCFYTSGSLLLWGFSDSGLTFVTCRIKRGKVRVPSSVRLQMSQRGL
tara:strand:+ start:495 stop:842 length:348 start_codon:yes stop_codon:yes gene_type:complete